MNYKPGDIIKNRYKIIQKFDDGNQGKTFLARDLATNSDCVVKHLDAKKSNPMEGLQRALHRFQKEAQILEQSKHERIPKFLDHFDFKEGQYLVQQYIEGRNLKQILQKYPKLSEFEVTCLLEQVLDVLHYIHGREIIHRDIKPANLIWRSKLGKIDLVLIDFGIIKEIGQNFTKTGWFIGTPAYVSPEQLDRKPATIRSDIYSLGKTAIEALIGKDPEMTNYGTVWPPQEEYTPELKNILNRMVKFNPEERYQSAQEVIDAINNLKNNICKFLEDTYSYRILDERECPIFGYEYLAQLGNSSSDIFIVKQLKPISTERFTLEDIKQELNSKKEILIRLDYHKKNRRRVEFLYDEKTQNLFLCVELIDSKKDRKKLPSEAYFITEIIRDIPKIQKRSIPPSSALSLKLRLQYFIYRVKLLPFFSTLLFIVLICVGVKLSLNEEYVIKLYYEGLNLSEKGENSKAIETYNRALNIFLFPPSEKNVRPKILVAKSFALGRLQPASPRLDRWDLCQEALKIDPEFTGALNCIGVMANELGEYEKAITNFDQAINLESAQSKPSQQLMFALFNKGSALEKWKKRDEARTAFEAALQEANKRINQNPNDSDAITIRYRSESKLLRK